MSKKDSKHFGTYIDRNFRIIRLTFLKAFKKAGVDLTTEQWVLMDSLYKQNGLAQSELAKGSFKDAPTVSRIIDLLCKKGFTERQRFDTSPRMERRTTSHSHARHNDPKGKERATFPRYGTTTRSSSTKHACR